MGRAMKPASQLEAKGFRLWRYSVAATLTRVLAVCGCSIFGSGLNPGCRWPEPGPVPEIAYIWTLNGPERFPNLSQKEECFALYLFEKGLEVDRARIHPNFGSGLNPGCKWPEPWLGVVVLKRA